MKKKFPFLLLSLTIFLNSFAQIQSSDFVLGAYWTPYITGYDASAAPADYNGDGATDLASRGNDGPQQGRWRIDIYDNSKLNGFDLNGWSYFQSTNNIYGDANYIPVPADYDNNKVGGIRDKKADIAVFDIVSRILWIDYQTNGFGSFDVSYDYSSFFTQEENAIPLVGDFDNDKKADISFKLNNGKWLIDYNNSGGLGNINFSGSIYGDQNSIPVPADYNGDGKTDLAIKNNSGIWKIDIAPSFGAWDTTHNFGSSFDNTTAFPYTADFDGDKKADLSFVNPVANTWIVYFSNSSPTPYTPITYIDHGVNAGTPIPSDYSGDGKAELSIYIKKQFCWLK